MSGFEEGDNAIAEFAAKMKSIPGQRRAFEDRVNMITGYFLDMANTWNLKGDDRVLSALRNEAVSAVDNAVKLEIEAMRKAGRTAPGKKKMILENARKIASGIEWLPEGVKAGIEVEIALAIAEIK